MKIKRKFSIQNSQSKELSAIRYPCLPAGRALSANKGFTIIELIMVVVILAILYYVFSTIFSPYYAIKLDTAKKKLTNDLKYAQQMSIAQTVNASGSVVHCGISFSTANNNYTVYKETSATPLTDPLKPGFNFIVDFDDDPYQGITISSVSFDAGSQIEFDAKGTPYINSSTLLSADGIVNLNYSGNSTTVIVTTGGRSY
jgi:prepilin-type N-terminal cleavage/methylation domain-containing protein